MLVGSGVMVNFLFVDSLPSMDSEVMSGLILVSIVSLYELQDLDWDTELGAELERDDK